MDRIHKIHKKKLAFVYQVKQLSLHRGQCTRCVFVKCPLFFAESCDKIRKIAEKGDLYEYSDIWQEQVL